MCPSSATTTKSTEDLIRIMRQNELILDAAGEGLYVLDTNGITTYVNPAAVNMLGWPVDELIGEPMHSLLHHTKPDGTHFPKQECSIYAAFKDGAVHHVDDEVFWRKDGSSFPVEYTSTPIRENGQLSGAVVVFQDISKRKQAEKAILQSEARFRRLFEYSADALFLLDPAQQARIIDCNQKACELLGYTKKELMSLRLSDIHPHEIPQFLAFTELVMESGSGQTSKLSCLAKDGQKIPAEILASTSIEHEGQQLILTSVRNISDRIQAQEAIARLQRQNELILQAAGEGIYGVDTDGLLTFVNPAAADMLGWNADSLAGQPGHQLVHHTKSDGTPYSHKKCPIYAAFKDGEVHHIENELFWRKDGSSFPVEYTSTPIRENGQLSGAVVVFKDITTRKQAEQELSQTYAEIERMKQQLESENVYLQEEMRAEHNFKDIIGQSKAIRHALQQIELVAPTYASVLINGESGTGKELFARAIHERSDRSQRPMIRVNCAAIPQELFESEFFGHVRGSFTGAIKDRSGRFELANGGTIFLDEVGEIPLELQSKLLRVLQEGEFQRVGEEKMRKVDVRVIAATNKDLKAAVENQEFREDLYYRLNVFPLEAIPLKERRDDIPLLTAYFIKLISGKLNRPEPRLTQGNINQLQAYDWPGNIRELQNLIERAIILSQNNQLQFQLPTNNNGFDNSTYNNPNFETPMTEQDSTLPSSLPFTETERRNRDRNNLLAALKMANGKVSGEGGAAELLEIRPTTFASRMKSLGVSKN